MEENGASCAADPRPDIVASCQNDVVNLIGPPETFMAALMAGSNMAIVECACWIIAPSLGLPHCEERQLRTKASMPVGTVKAMHDLIPPSWGRTISLAL